MPRFPENSDLCVTLKSINSKRQNSFIIFISHCWMRGHDKSEGYDGRAHPDNVNHDKFKLCVSGIEKRKGNFAPDMQHCYIWLDFGCLDQNGKPIEEMGVDLTKLSNTATACSLQFMD